MNLIKQIHTYYLKQRFFPDFFSLIINPFYFSRKNLLKHIRYLSVELQGKLLDFGCGSKPYKELFSNVTEYIGIDVENDGHDHITEEIDLYYDGETIPFEDEIFNSVLVSEVLEHVPDIDKSLGEIRRVLKKDGKLLVTIPFVCPEHEMPFDFRRYTENGIEDILIKNGFNIVNCNKCGNFVEVLFQLWMLYFHSLLYTKNKYINIFINTIFIFPICLLGLLFSNLLPKKKELYFNIVILAQKI